MIATTTSISALGLLVKIFPSLATNFNTQKTTATGISFCVRFVALEPTVATVPSPQVKKTLGVMSTNAQNRTLTHITSVKKITTKPKVTSTLLLQTPATPTKQLPTTVDSSKARKLQVFDESENMFSPIRAIHTSTPARRNSPSVSTPARDGFHGLLFSSPAATALAGSPLAASIFDDLPADKSFDSLFDGSDSFVHSGIFGVVDHDGCIEIVDEDEDNEVREGHTPSDESLECMALELEDFMQATAMAVEKVAEALARVSSADDEQKAVAIADAAEAADASFGSTLDYYFDDGEVNSAPAVIISPSSPTSQIDAGIIPVGKLVPFLSSPESSFDSLFDGDDSNPDPVALAELMDNDSLDLSLMARELEALMLKNQAEEAAWVQREKALKVSPPITRIPSAYSCIHERCILCTSRPPTDLRSPNPLEVVKPTLEPKSQSGIKRSVRFELAPVSVDPLVESSFDTTEDFEMEHSYTSALPVIEGVVEGMLSSQGKEESESELREARAMQSQAEFAVAVKPRKVVKGWGVKRL